MPRIQPSEYHRVLPVRLTSNHFAIRDTASKFRRTARFEVEGFVYNCVRHNGGRSRVNEGGNVMVRGEANAAAGAWRDSKVRVRQL